jgi:hypothetical protein
MQNMLRQCNNCQRQLTHTGSIPHNQAAAAAAPLQLITTPHVLEHGWLNRQLL